MAFRPTLRRNPSSNDCHVCIRMDERKPCLQTGDSALCLLCNRVYCERHKGKEDDVCEINHVKYYTKHQGLSGVFPSMERRGEQLQEKGDKVDKEEVSKTENGDEERGDPYYEKPNVDV